MRRNTEIHLSSASRCVAVAALAILVVSVNVHAMPLDDAIQEYKLLKCERVGPVFVARFNNPPEGLMNSRQLGELSDLLDKIEEDEQTRVLILTGNLPGVFIKHFDVGAILRGAAAARAAALSQVAQKTEKPRQAPQSSSGRRAAGGLQGTLLKMEHLSKPIIAAINGQAQGGGFELALACDFRVMAIGAGTIGLPEVNLGIIPGLGGTQRLPRLIGKSRAMSLILRGKVVDAERAERYGMIHEAVPVAPGQTAEEAVLATAMKLAQELVALPAMALGQAKRAIHQGLDMPLDEGLGLESEAFSRVMASDDAWRLMNAYIKGELSWSPEK